ncbi:MAG: AbrB/MazE/SpoVT family DNA-binding domain-containing protein [Candidatus Woesebacteria bacterium]|nr:AbrB/MazE/SpoVT family DNA-binding domain-containing protein [Candidatus Woesebacteria bacterium]
MQQLVSITSQGQITIPASFRKQLGLDKYLKALVKIEGERIIVEPVPDLLSLAGILHHKAIKGKNIGQIIKMEEDSIAGESANKYLTKK